MSIKFIKRLGRDFYLWSSRLRYNYFRRRFNYRRKDSIKLWYWKYKKHEGNFGDEITKDIINRLFGYKVEWSPLSSCDMIGAGSVMESAIKEPSKNHIYVWGSGFIVPGESYPDGIDNLTICAVRGLYTKERLKVREKTAIGDPGLLADIVYQRADKKTNKIGVVVHYIDMDEPIVAEIRKDSRFIIIDPIDTPDNVALKISSCRLILSSSLHGLIFADSFNIPNYHIILSDKVVGGEYKFRDYYSATKRSYESANVDMIFDDEYLDGKEHSYKGVDNIRNIQKDLIKSFPF